MSTCYECAKECPGDIWELGQCLVFGMLFTCSRACAEALVRSLAGREPQRGDIAEEKNEYSTPVP